MRTIICLVLGMTLGACAANVGTSGAQERAIARVHKKHAILVEKRVRAAFDAAKGVETEGVAKLVDMTVAGTAVRQHGMDAVTVRLGAQVCPADGECGTEGTGLVVKNRTGQHLILLVDGMLTLVVSEGEASDHIAPGMAVNLTIPPKEEGFYGFVGAAFDEPGPWTKASKVFVADKAIVQGAVNVLIITPEMLVSR